MTRLHTRALLQRELVPFAVLSAHNGRAVSLGPGTSHGTICGSDPPRIDGGGAPQALRGVTAAKFAWFRSSPIS